MPQVPQVPRVGGIAMLLVGSWSAAISLAALGQAAPTGATRTLNNGVYTDAQAARGLKIYETNCGICHDTGRFTDDKFFADWDGKPLLELFTVISTTMPEDNPGGLKPQQYVDVVAALLAANRFATGPDELKADPDALRGIAIVRPAAKDR